MNSSHWQHILYALADQLDIGLHIVLKDKSTLIYNKAMANLEGQREEDVIGKDFRQVFSNIPEEESTLLKAIKRGEVTYNKEQRYLNKYGKWIHTVNTTVPVRDISDNIIGALELAKDITQIVEMSDKLFYKERNMTEDGVADQELRERPGTYHFTDLIGRSPIFVELIDKAKMAAETHASVFLYGETGTGKELVAQSIHNASHRKDGPFLAQNCAALPESLLEGILFGTSKGGFTGALDREGLFEQASRGTLLLDEISAMPYGLQGKLLRVLQENYIRRLGGTRDIPVNPRIIATVNEEPEKLIKEGRLRKDLYYRLNVLSLRLPPLRERKEDVEELAIFFIKKHSRLYKKNIKGIGEEGLAKLRQYPFPGNVRELENIIMSAITLAREEDILEESHLSLPMAGQVKGLGPDLGPSDGLLDISQMGKSLDQYIEDKEKRLIETALLKRRGNISQAAMLLGIKRQTLQHKIKKYDLRGAKEE